MFRKISDRMLLIGNGVNLINPFNHFNNADIASRFQCAIGEVKDVFNALFLEGQCQEQDNLYDASDCNSNDNIEQLLGKVYKFLIQTLNYEVNKEPTYIKQRITDLLLQVGIKSIFIQDNKWYAPSVPRSYSSRFKRYQAVATLNYHENWDCNNKCLYVHGRLDLDKYRNLVPKANSKPLVLYSKLRYEGLPEYKSAIDKLGFTTCLIESLEAQNLVMVPDVFPKDSLTTDWYPSERLLPANDLVLGHSNAQYDFFKNVKRIDILGVSPYGDDSLIEILRSIPSVTIFVHDYMKDKGQNESSLWKLKIPHAEVLDSSSFLNIWLHFINDLGKLF